MHEGELQEKGCDDNTIEFPPNLLPQYLKGGAYRGYTCIASHTDVQWFSLSSTDFSLSTLSTPSTLSSFHSNQ